MSEPPDRGVHAAALLELPACGAACLASLLARHRAPELWSLVVSDRLGDLVSPGSARRWRDHARGVELDRLARDLAASDVVVTTRHDQHHPAALVDDIDPAPVLFRRGRPVDDQAPTAAVVGTRRCTPTGREIAEAIGFGLAREGVVVVSGLALGVDGAAHRGALRAATAPPVAVVGSGLDVVYPRPNAGLWADLAAAGTLLSEASLGARPEAWRFPARNRLIAALADVVVVVESKAAGGSMLTVDQAVRRGRPVLAVPGSVRNPAAAGTNLLISEGCAPVCGVADVLAALDLTTAGSSPRLLTAGGHPLARSDIDAKLDGSSVIERRILETVDFAGSSLDGLCLGLDLPVGAVAAAVVLLEQRGLVTLVDGVVRRRVLLPTTSGGGSGTSREPLASKS